MKKLIVTALIMAVGICIGASNAWAGDPQTIEIGDQPISDQLETHLPDSSIGIRITCGNGLLDANEECSWSGDQSVNDMPTEQDPTLPDKWRKCDEANGEYCKHCKCIKPDDVAPVCNDGVWHGAVEDCDYDALTPIIRKQCELSLSMTPGALHGYDVRCDTANCECHFCGNGVIENDSTFPGLGLDEECDGQAVGACHCNPTTCKCTTCGDGNLDAGEQCDPGMADPLEACEDICDPDTHIILECTEPDPITGREGCKCNCEDKIDTCGNGVFDPPAEECSNSSGDPNLDPDQWTDKDVDVHGNEVPVLCDAGKQCTFCKCKEAPACRNGILEAGEECEVGAGNECKDSQGNIDPEAICTMNCTCEKEPPPDCPPQDCPDCCDEGPSPNVGKYACSIEIDGFSSPGHQRLIEKQNKRFAEAIEGTNIAEGSDFVGEAGFSTVQIVLRAKDTVAEDETKFATGKAQSANGMAYGNWAWLALSGTPPIDFMTRKFKPPTKVYFDKPTRIFPILPQDLVAAGISASVAGVPSGLKAMELPDLSSSLSAIDLGLSGPIDVDNVTMALGGADINIQSSEAFNWRLNNVATLELKPGMSVNKTTAGEGIGDTMVVWKAIIEPDRASWTGPEGRPVLMPHEKPEDLWIENRMLDFGEVMKDVDYDVAQCKAGTGPCDCSMLLNKNWEKNLYYQYLFVQDTVQKTGGAGTAVPEALGVAHISFIGGVGRGGGGVGCGHCSLNSVIPPMSHLALWLGMGLSGLAGIIAVRRRKR
jgi:hypothetical protein